MRVSRLKASTVAICAIMGAAWSEAGAQVTAPGAVAPGLASQDEAGAAAAAAAATRLAAGVKASQFGPSTQEVFEANKNLTSEKGYKVPRLAIGQPDLQGVWSNASNTRLTRAGNRPLVMTDAEYQEAVRTNPQNIRQQTDDGQNADQKLTGKDLASGRGYNSFWIDPGTSYANVKGTWRSSWIVEPANGQVPFNPNARAGMRGARRPVGGEGENVADASASIGADGSNYGYDNPEERGLAERCIVLPTSGPPIGNYLYNQNLRIVQSPDHVVIESEMIHDARIIPLNAKHKPPELTAYMGDSVGWWEGDVLVVETINHAKSGGMVRLSPSGKIIERFSRWNDNQVLYTFEVIDPVNYTQPWKGEMSLNAVSTGMYEYACHEGNYAMPGILAGGRLAQAEFEAKQAATKKSGKSSSRTRTRGGN